MSRIESKSLREVGGGWVELRSIWSAALDAGVSCAIVSTGATGSGATTGSDTSGDAADADGVSVSAGDFGLEGQKGHNDKFREAPDRWAKTLDAVAARTVREPIDGIDVEDAIPDRLDNIDRDCA